MNFEELTTLYYVCIVYDTTGKMIRAHFKPREYLGCTTGSVKYSTFGPMMPLNA